MKSRRMSSANLFLLELVIVICFFAVAGMIVMQVFLKADELTAKSAEQNGAMMLAQQTLENVRTLPFEQLTAGKEQRYYNAQWEEVEKQEAIYTLTLNITLQPKAMGTMMAADCRIMRNDQLPDELQTAQAEKKEARAADSVEKEQAAEGKEIFQLQDKKYFRSGGNGIYE